MAFRYDDLDAADETSRSRTHVETGGILVLWSPVDDALPIDEFVLTDADRAAARRLHFERDRRVLAWSRALTRRGLALLGVPADIEPVRSSFGRPSLDSVSLQFSPSRTSTVVACAYKRAGPLGLDIETRHRLGTIDDLIGDMMIAAERTALEAIDGERRIDAVLKTWTRKEAVLKAIGCGLSVPPDSFAIDLATARVSGLRGVSGWPDDAWRFHECWLSAEVHCSVALADDAASRVLVRSLRPSAAHPKKPRIEA